MSKRGGFTLAELVVATAIISITMAGVYWLFHGTVRTWSLAERGEDPYLNARLALSMLGRELDNVVYPAQRFFEGAPHELQMIVVAEPMDVEDEEESGRRMLLVRYRYNAAGNELVREERRVERLELPNNVASSEMTEGEESLDGFSEIDAEGIDEVGKLDLGSRETFTIAENVKDFELYYYWIAAQERNGADAATVPPVWREPIPARRHEAGWGMPNGVGAVLVMEDPENEGAEVTVEFRHAFRGPVQYRTAKGIEKLIGSAAS